MANTTIIILIFHLIKQIILIMIAYKNKKFFAIRINDKKKPTLN